MERFVLFTTFTSLLVSGCMQPTGMGEPPQEVEEAAFEQATPMERVPQETEEPTIDSLDVPTRFAQSTISPCEVRDLGIDIRMYPDANFTLPLDPIVRGCEQWSPLGVRCSIVTDPGEANLTLVERPCDPEHLHGAALTEDPDTPTPFSITYFGCQTYGYDPEARAYVPGIHPERGEEPYTSFRAQSLAVHEVGHAIGIGPHIPSTCTGGEPEDPEVGPICGPAIMNFGHHVSELTDLDLAAFRRRSRTESERFLLEPQQTCHRP